MELIILTNISIILLILLLSSFINEYTGVQKIKSKKRKYTIYTVLVIVNFIYFFDSYNEDETLLSSNLIILGIDILFILTNFFSLIFKRKGFYGKYMVLGILFLILPFFTTMMFALRGLPHG